MEKRSYIKVKDNIAITIKTFLPIVVRRFFISVVLTKMLQKPDYKQFIWNIILSALNECIEFIERELFVEALQEFCEESNFYEFYNVHEDYYKKIIDGTVESLSGTDYVSQIEEYYGRKQNSYNIILSGLLHANNYGPSVKDKDGNFNIYSIQGSVGLLNDVPLFGGKDIFQYLVRHEFSHSFVNNLTVKNYEKINKYKSLLKPIKKKMSDQAYSNWDATLNEHLVRTVVIRLTEIHDGKEKAQTLRDTEVQKGFIYIKSLENLLKTEYETNRDEYPNFEDFYHEIINLLDELYEEEIKE